jgi:hypothetical protein
VFPFHDKFFQVQGIPVQGNQKELEKKWEQVILTIRLSEYIEFKNLKLQFSPVPLFHPGAHEFRYFGEYIETLDASVPRGVCKITPPSSWEFFRSEWALTELKNLSFPVTLQYISIQFSFFTRQEVVWKSWLLYTIYIRYQQSKDCEN